MASFNTKYCGAKHWMVPPMVACSRSFLSDLMSFFAWIVCLSDEIRWYSIKIDRWKIRIQLTHKSSKRHTWRIQRNENDGEEKYDIKWYRIAAIFLLWQNMRCNTGYKETVLEQTISIQIQVHVPHAQHRFTNNSDWIDSIREWIGSLSLKRIYLVSFRYLFRRTLQTPDILDGAPTLIDRDIVGAIRCRWNVLLL